MSKEISQLRTVSLRGLVLAATAAIIAGQLFAVAQQPPHHPSAPTQAVIASQDLAMVGGEIAIDSVESRAAIAKQTVVIKQDQLRAAR